MKNGPMLHAVFLVTFTTPLYAISVIEGPVTRPETGNTYYLLENGSWTASEQFAEDSLGGSLVLIDDSLENTWVFDTFSPLIPTWSTPKHGWIGLQYDDTADTWVGPQGEEISYVNWLDNDFTDYPQSVSSADNFYVRMLMEEFAAWYTASYWVNFPDLGPAWIGWDAYGIVEVEYVALTRNTWAGIKVQNR